MKRKTALLAVSGISLLIIGALLTFYASRRYTVHRYIVDAGSCRMSMDTVRLANAAPGADVGSVVLFHGISANKLIMQYIAEVSPNWASGCTCRTFRATGTLQARLRRYGPRSARLLLYAVWQPAV